MALSVSTNSASVSGLQLTANGSINVGSAISRGFVWTYGGGTPTITNNNGSVYAGSGSGSFSATPTVNCGQTIKVRAYGYDGSTYYYGGTITAGNSSTCPVVPTVTTTSPSNITYSGCTAGGNISLAGYPATVTSRGVCWSTNINPTIADNHTTNGSGTGNFTSTVTGLQQNTTYYLRAYAVNDTGVGYGLNIQFTTTALPVLTTKNITSITETSAVSGGIITSSGSSTITQRGICWAYTNNPTIYNHKNIDTSGLDDFTLSITGISQNHTYHVRAFATNTQGTAYGDDQVFSIAVTPPVLVGGTDVHLFPLIGWSGSTSSSSWTGNTNTKWYYKVSTDINYTLIATSGNSYSKIDLLPNINYSFYCTYNGSVESQPSNIITIINNVEPPTITLSSNLIV